MFPNTPVKRASTLRTSLRILLVAGIAAITSWTAFTSHSAKLGKSKNGSGGSAKVSSLAQERVTPEARAKIDEQYGQLPLSFEVNRGQTDASVKYVARGPGYNIFVKADEAVIVFRNAADNKSTEVAEDPEEGSSPHSRRSRPRSASGEPADDGNRAKVNPTVLRMRLDGANPNAREVEGIEQLQGKVNYFIGNDSSKWLTDVATYRKVVYRDAYPGIDMVYYGNRQQLEYDLIVAPGADPGVISLSYEGASKIKVDPQGNLVLKTAAGEVRQLKPVVYQEINGKKQPIEGRYVVRGEDRVGFRVSRYDRSKPLVIDPILVYSSLVSAGGGGGAIAVDSNGYAYITGYAEDLNPTTGAFQTLLSGDYATFVTKINQSGTDVVYSTFIGGNSTAESFGIAVDAAGNAYITGYASGTYPTTPGAFQTVRASDFDCFITKLNAAGNALVYSTFYGGAEFDEGLAIAVDAAGNAYVAGDSTSRNLVTTAGALQTTNGGGSDNFVVRLNSTGSGLGYASYLGGGGSEIPLSIAVDTANNIYVAGETSSFNFPQVNSLQGPGGMNRGLFRSTNNGTSWSLSNSGLNTSQVNAIVINPITTAIMYAGTIGGVSKSVNGGATWIATGPITGSVRCLAIDPTNTSTVYAGTGNGVYKTTNGGDSWTAISNGIVFPLVSNANFPVAIRALAVDPNNPATVYAASGLGFYKTTNGGGNWTRIGTGTGLTTESFLAVVFDPVTPSTIYAGATGSGVFKSTNSGATWTVMNTGLTDSSSRNVRSLAIVPNAPATLYLGTVAGIFKTTNGGTTWTAVNNGLLVPFTDNVSRLPSSVNAIVIDPITSSTVYAGSSSNQFSNGAFPLTSIFKSTDGGANWAALTNGFSNLNNGVQTLAINLSDPSLLYAGTFGDFDGYATKINASGTSLNYSTFVGSNRNDFIAGIASDSAGNTYLSGVTAGTNLPTTAGAFDTTLSGSSDTFAMKLNASGTARIYSTYLGGSFSEDSFGLAVDSAGNAYVFGDTTSTDFPVTVGAFQTTIGDRGVRSTTDAFITKLNATGNALVYSSYLGGAGSELFDFEGSNLALDPLGNAYVVGETDDRNTFPVLGYANAFSPSFGPSQTFVAKIDGNTASYSIRGQVTTNTLPPFAGLIVEVKNAQGGLLRTGVTDAEGFYSIVSLPAGDYTVTPQKYGPTAHYLFTPASRTFNALSADQTANFTGTQVYDIQGRVTSSTVGGLGIFDVTITLSGAASATTITDANGSYILRDLLPGNYTVTPSKVGFTFDPVNLPFTNLSANQTNANFTTASGTFFTISGRVADGVNAGVSGVRISLVSVSQSGNRRQLRVTDADGSYLFTDLQAGGNYTLTAAKALLSFTPASQTFNNLSGNQVLNFTASTVAIQATINTWKLQGRTYVYVKLSYPNSGFRVANSGNPVRAGNDFTVDAVVDVDTGGAQIQAITTTAQIYDLGVVADGNYTFTFKNSGTVLKTQAFTVSSTTPPANPIDDARQFVKQQYRDFLNREADQAGEDFWTDNITKCNDPARRPPGQTVEQCTLRQRETTSGAFFLSPEFQYTGYYVYRMYRALGRKPKLSEFTTDAQFVGNGIVVNGQLSAARINQNKADFAAQFANCTDPAKSRCAEFKAIYDATPNQEYVDQLFFTTGINASAADRAALVSQLNGGASRASVLQKVVDGINVISEGNQQFTTVYGQAFYNAQFNGAFVQLEYFGYMKRDPDDAGYAFWLGKLNQFGGNFVNAEMVLAFISSPEYRARFGQP